MRRAPSAQKIRAARDAARQRLRRLPPPSRPVFFLSFYQERADFFLRLRLRLRLRERERERERARARLLPGLSARPASVYAIQCFGYRYIYISPKKTAVESPRRASLRGASNPWRHLRATTTRRRRHLPFRTSPSRASLARYGKRPAGRNRQHLPSTTREEYVPKRRPSSSRFSSRRMSAERVKRRGLRGPALRAARRRAAARVGRGRGG